MKISVLGLGYVGAVSAGCLAADGHMVIGTDPNKRKVDLINKGRSPIVEKDIGTMIADAVDARRLRATSDPADAVRNSEISLVCVGTPSQENGNLDLTYVENVCKDIGLALKGKNAHHLVVVRSTMLPGSMRNTVIPLLEKHSGKIACRDFDVCLNPEFLREGSAVYDYYHPPKIVIGEAVPGAGSALAALYENLDAPVIRTDIETAEMVKYTDNAWHALKVSFANEIGNLCKAVGIDSHRVMQIFSQDQKLNLSAYYMRPGFAFGGSCLPKDVRALIYKGRSLDLDLPLMNAIIPSNRKQIEHGLKLITSKGVKKIGILGFAFKAGTDDLRESPMVEVIEYLLGKGYVLRLYDKSVNLAAITGANQDYILNRISHISSLMVNSVDEVLQHADTIVIGNASDEFKDVLHRIRPHQSVVDLVRISQEKSGYQYDGICW